MYEEDIEIAVKVVVVGNGAVGKSSMIQRYCKGVFTREYKKTIGVDFLEKTIRLEGHYTMRAINEEIENSEHGSLNSDDVRLMLWDTAGQEEFDAITKSYYRGAQVCVLVFSTVDYASYAAIPRWKEKVICEVGNIPMVLVQNKMDLLDDSAVTQEEAEGLAKKLRLRLYRSSVKEDLNVSDVFEYLAQKYVETMKSNEVEETTQIAAPTIQNGSRKSNKIILDKTRKKKKKFCF